MASHIQLAALAAVIAFADASVASADPVVASIHPSVQSSNMLSYFGYPVVRHLRPPPYRPAPRVQITAADRLNAVRGGWQPVTATAPFGSNGGGTALLMTDGTVMISDNQASWYSLTPDNTGNYVNGTWSKKATLPSGYGPLYFASAVLADGNLIINGGEYNFLRDAETNLGAIYNPLANTWKSVPAPSGWSEIGDAQSAVLPNGTYMLGNCCYNSQALLNEKSLTWTPTGAGKADTNSEEGWTLLASGKLLTADVGSEPNSELYNPATGSWSSAGPLPANLTQSFEIGPQMLRADGTVFVAGADAHTAIYNTATGVWKAGPDFPKIAGQQVEIADGPASLLPNGNVLMAVSPGVYSSPSYFLTWDGTKFAQVAAPPNAPNDSSYVYRLLVLPTGQILETDFSNDVEIYTPKGKANSAIAPVISSVPSKLTHANTYMISGKLFNGISQANAYGDDAEAATNYPLVAITNTASGHVFFARTHNHSSMAVDSPATVSTMFDVPSNIELGAAKLVVVTNGIQSSPVAVTIK